MIDIEQIKYKHHDNITRSVDLDVHCAKLHNSVQYDWTLVAVELSRIREPFQEDETEIFCISAGADCFVFQLERLWKEHWWSKSKELAPRFVLKMSQCRAPLNVQRLEAMVAVKCSVNSYDAECMYQKEIVKDVRGSFPLFGDKFEFEIGSRYVAGCDYVRLDIDIKMISVCDLNGQLIPKNEWRENGIM